jgi:cobalt/nickel transport system permease protein
MKDRAALIAYAAAVIAATSIHSIPFLSCMLAAAFLASGRKFPRLARRAALAIVLFNSVVTVTYAILSVLQHNFSLRFVVLVNMRVFLLTFLTFFLAATTNLFNAFSFSRSLSFLLTLAYSQIANFRRLFDDFRLALKSRTLVRPARRDLYRHGAATGSYFIGKCYRDSAEIAQAMESRGFFDAHR